MEERAGMNWIYCRERNPSENGDYYDKLDVFAWMPIPKPAVRK